MEQPNAENEPMKLPVAVALLALAACGGRADDAVPADSASVSPGTGYDPDTTMAPPPVMDSSMQQAVPATDTIAPADSARQR
jgi:hypothetical protein